MSPYAHFHGDCDVISKPALRDLVELVTRSRRRGLLIVDYQWESFEPLARFPALEVLKIQTRGRLESLAGLGALTKLRTLAITPPPSWDGSHRCIDVASYRPLRGLGALEQLTLLNVRPRDLDLSPIAAMQHLKELNIAGVPEFTLEHYAKLAAALPHTSGRCLQPYVEIEGVGFCRRCRGRTVMLTGAPPRTRRWLCPACDAHKLHGHVQQWQAFKASAPTNRVQ